MRKRMGIAVILLAAGLAACGPKSEDGTVGSVQAESAKTTETGTQADGSGQETSSEAGTAQEVQAQVTQAAADQVPTSQAESGKPGAPQAGSSKPGSSNAGTNQQGAEKPDSQPGAPGGTGQPGAPGGTAQPGEQGAADQTADQTLTDIHAAIKKAFGERYIPSQVYQKTDLEEMFGIKKDWYDSFIAEGPMYSMHVETFIGIKAKPGKAGDVKAALESSRSNALNGMQYPMNMTTLQASQVIQHGDYVFYVMLGSASMEAQEKGDEAALEAAKKDNQVAVDIINNYFKGK